MHDRRSHELIPFIPISSGFHLIRVTSVTNYRILFGSRNYIRTRLSCDSNEKPWSIRRPPKHSVARMQPGAMTYT